MLARTVGVLMLSLGLLVAISPPGTAGLEPPQVMIEVRFVTVSTQASRALGVNILSEVVGEADNNGILQAFRWDVVNGIQWLSGSAPSRANAVNDRGYMCGDMVPPGGTERQAVIWEPTGSGVSNFHPPGFVTSSFLAINNLNQAVGYAVGADGVTCPMVLESLAGPARVVAPPPGTHQTIVDVNDRGEAVGNQTDAAQNQIGLLWPDIGRPNRRFPVIPLGYFESKLLGIGESGLVSGAAFMTRSAPIPMVLRPRITQRAVELDVQLELQDELGTSLDTEGPAGAKGSVATSVRVADGETIVLGGLKSDEDATRLSIPYLTEIPVLGHLFRDRSRQSKKSLLLFITPTITGDAGSGGLGIRVLPQPQAALVVLHNGQNAAERPGSLNLNLGAPVMHKATGLFRQKIKFKAREDLPGPVALRLDGLQFQVRPANPSGATLVTSPLGVPYIQLSHKGLKKGDKGSITAVFEAPDQASLGVTPVILAGGNM